MLAEKTRGNLDMTEAEVLGNAVNALRGRLGNESWAVGDGKLACGPSFSGSRGRVVRWAAQVTGQIGAGLVVLLGVAPADTPDTARSLAAKLVKLRIFGDEAGKMNRSLADIGGAVLSISQFTLFADTSSGKPAQLPGSRAA